MAVSAGTNLDQVGVGHYLLGVHLVNERLGQRHVSNAAHVESVDIVPPVDLVVLVVAVLDGQNVKRGLVGEHETAGYEPLVTGVQDRVQHGLVEETVAHPFRNDNVDLFDAIWESIDIFDFSFDELDGLKNEVMFWFHYFHSSIIRLL